MSKKKIKEKKEDEQNSKTENESELEKEIEETESQEENKALEKTSEKTIEDNEFNKFIQPFLKSLPPILEKIEIPQQESLEQNVGSAPIIQEKKDEKSKDYSTISNEPNYSSSEKIKYQANTGPPILKPKGISEDLPRQGLLEPITRTQNNLRSTMIDPGFIEHKTRLPFEKDDKKYKEIKL